LIIEISEALFAVLTVLLMTYLIRHYIFTVTVLKNTQKRKSVVAVRNTTFQPTVSILIPAHNEEQVIGRIL
jgi:cellulose synthase/poly-beta-1,6-N-acetylglucosamine synthase-like glycosyltransferase